MSELDLLLQAAKEMCSMLLFQTLIFSWLWHVHKRELEFMVAVEQLFPLMCMDATVSLVKLCLARWAIG